MGQRPDLLGQRERVGIGGQAAGNGPAHAVEQQVKGAFARVFDLGMSLSPTCREHRLIGARPARRESEIGPAHGDQSRHRLGFAPDGGGQTLSEIPEAAPRDLGDQRLPVGKMPVGRGGGDSGLAGCVAQGEASGATFVQQLFRNGDERILQRAMVIPAPLGDIWTGGVWAGGFLDHGRERHPASVTYRGARRKQEGLLRRHGACDNQANRQGHRCMDDKAKIIFPIVMAAIMAFMMTAVITWLNIGFVPDFPMRWMTAFAVAWPCAVGAIFIAMPLARRATGLIVSRLER